MSQLTFDKQPPPIKLEIRGLTIPSFKNNKLIITKTPQGKPLNRALIITKPEFQKVMRTMEADFERQLLSDFRATEGQTSAGSSIRSWIASSIPADDCWANIPEIIIKGELCEPGNEGASILIERI